MAVHDPAWPDRIMSAALLIIMGGLLGIAFVLLRWAGATVELQASPILAQWPSGLMLGAGLAAVALGGLAYFHQSWLLAVLGIAANILSLGFLGISSLVGIIAVWPLVLSFREGEETRLDRHRMRAHQWPDKALLASTLLSVASAATLVHGMLLLGDRIAPPAGVGSQLWAAVSLLAAGLTGAASRQAFRLRRLWLAWSAVLLLAASLAFYVLGPLLAGAVALYLWLAQREGEYARPAAPEAA